MVARTRLNVKLYVNCLSCLVLLPKTIFGLKRNALLSLPPNKPAHLPFGCYCMQKINGKALWCPSLDNFHYQVSPKEVKSWNRTHKHTVWLSQKPTSSPFSGTKTRFKVKGLKYLRLLLTSNRRQNTVGSENKNPAYPREKNALCVTQTQEFIWCRIPESTNRQLRMTFFFILFAQLRGDFVNMPQIERTLLPVPSWKCQNDLKFLKKKKLELLGLPWIQIPHHNHHTPSLLPYS
jgi:hypothetical protein